jgi:hypothetical protein
VKAQSLAVAFVAFLIVTLTGCTQQGDVASTVARSAEPAFGRSLLYVSDAGNDDVQFFVYPRLKFVATLTGFGAVRGLCLGKAGEIYVVDAKNSQVVIYKHGAKTPSRILYDQEYAPNGCAVDPINGRLAVTLVSQSSGPGVVATFGRGDKRPVYRGIARIYTPAYCAFDDKGNLYVDGADKEGNFALSELPFTYFNFSNITLNQTIAVAGAVQWDGKYLAVGDQGTGTGSTVYRFSIASFNGTNEGTVTLGGSTDVTQFWIVKHTLIGPNGGTSPSVLWWDYPQGGSPRRTLTGFSDPVGVVESPA